jgi:hypothetical protein
MRLVGQTVAHFTTLEIDYRRLWGIFFAGLDSEGADLKQSLPAVNGSGAVATADRRTS